MESQPAFDFYSKKITDFNGEPDRVFTQARMNEGNKPGKKHFPKIDEMLKSTVRSKKGFQSLENDIVEVGLGPLMACTLD